MTIKSISKQSVWLVSPYEIPPGLGYRESRWELLSQKLIENGHQATCIISDFCHHKKQHRKLPETKSKHGAVYVSLPAIGYKGHITIRRVVSELYFATQFLFYFCQAKKKPDLIVVKEPPLCVGIIGLLAKKVFGVKLVVDVIDLWPELHAKIIPQPQAKIFTPLFRVWFCLRTILLANADRVVLYANEMASVVPKNQKPFLVYNAIIKTANPQTDPRLEEIIAKIESIDAAKFVYAGTLGENYDIKCVLDCFKKSCPLDLKSVVLIFGSGPKEEEVKKAETLNSQRIIFFGRIPFDWLAPILEKCDVGLLPYCAASTVVLPDKFYDYINAGIPMLTSIRGEVGQIIKEHEIGESYVAGSVESLSNAISIFSNKKCLKKYRQKSSNAQLVFSADVQFSNYARLIDEIIS